MYRHNGSLLLRPFSYTPVSRIWLLSSKTQLPEGCGQDLCDFFTNRCVCVTEFLIFMLPKCDLAKQYTEFLHSRSLKRGIFQRVWTPRRIDVCQPFYRFWHSASSSLWYIVDSCILFYRFRESASSSLWCIFESASIGVNSSIDPDIPHVRDLGALSICRHSSIDSSILHLGVWFPS